MLFMMMINSNKWEIRKNFQIKILKLHKVVIIKTFYFLAKTQLEIFEFYLIPFDSNSHDVVKLKNFVKMKTLIETKMILANVK